MLQLDEIKEAASDVARANGAKLAVLFGSYARGTATERSDVDLIFVEETDKRYLDRLDGYYYQLVDRLRTPVEMFVYTPSEFERMKDQPFVARAVAEGIVLYESGES
jgi:predicted nucleotidyltransferase